MDSPTLPSPFPAHRVNEPEDYQRDTIEKLHRDGLDSQALISIAKFSKAHSVRSVLFRIESYIRMSNDASIEDVTDWVHSVERQANKTSFVETPAQQPRTPMLDDFPAPPVASQPTRASNKRSRAAVSPEATTPMQSSSVLKKCTETCCENRYKFKGHFLQHFSKKHHLTSYPQICCDVVFQGDNDEDFPKHRWEYHSVHSLAKLTNIPPGRTSMPQRLPSQYLRQIELAHRPASFPATGALSTGEGLLNPSNLQTAPHPPTFWSPGVDAIGSSTHPPVFDPSMTPVTTQQFSAQETNVGPTVPIRGQDQFNKGHGHFPSYFYDPSGGNPTWHS